MKIKIAVVQFGVDKPSIAKKLVKAEKFIKEASAKKADIIVFPEYFLADNIKFADSNKKYCKHFQYLVKKYHIDIVVGSILEKDKNKFYNSSYYIDKKGLVLSRYRKINLWNPERKNISFGKKISVFNTAFGKIGLCICWDLIFPEVFRSMVRSGVEIVFCPSYWSLKDGGQGIKYNPNAEIELVDSLCVGRVFENEIIFVFCNAVSKTDKLLGHSQITIPFKGVIKKLNHANEEMFIQEVDTSILKVAEESYKIRKDLKERIK